MKKILLILMILVQGLMATVHVSASYPFITQLTQTIGGDQVEVTTLAKGNWDPHFVVPRPSLIRDVASSDLLIINGGGLEIGWMPPLIRQSHNARIQPGTKGFLDLSQSVTLINIPLAVSRANGDIHPNGNPHYVTDPYVIPVLAEAIEKRLALLDPEHTTLYQNNLEQFKQKWAMNLKRWDTQMQAVKGKKLIQYHELFNYFIKRYGLITMGNIEPLPGINPSSRHTLDLIKLIKSKKISLILQDVYHSSKTANYIAQKTGAKVILMPHDVDALDSVDSLEKLYESMIERVTQ